MRDEDALSEISDIGSQVTEDTYSLEGINELYSISETESHKFKMRSEHCYLRSQNSTEAQESKTLAGRCKSDP